MAYFGLNRLVAGAVRLRPGRFFRVNPKLITTLNPFFNNSILWLHTKRSHQLMSTFLQTEFLLKIMLHHQKNSSGGGTCVCIRMYAFDIARRAAIHQPRAHAYIAHNTRHNTQHQSLFETLSPSSTAQQSTQFNTDNKTHTGIEPHTPHTPHRTGTGHRRWSTIIQPVTAKHTIT